MPTAGFGSIIKNAGVTGLGSIAGQIANYGMVLLLTMALGAGGFGLFSLALVVLNFATLIGSLSLGVTVLRFTALYKGNGNNQNIQILIGTVLVFVSVWSLITAVVVNWGAAFLAEWVFQKPELTDTFQIVAWAIPLNVLFNIFISGLHGLGFTDTRAYLEQLILPISRLLLVAVSVTVASTVTSALWAMVIASYVSTLIAAIGLAYRCPFWEIGKQIPHDWLRWTKYTIPTFLDAMLVTSLGGSIEVLLLGIFGTKELVGIYSVVLKFKTILNLPMMAFNNALAPEIGDYHARGEHDKLQTLFYSASRWVMMLALPVAATFILFGDLLLGLFGETFSIGYIALIIVTIGQLVNIGVGPVGHILLMTGYSRIRLINSLVLLTIQLVLGLWLIPNWQLTGASLVAAVSVGIISLLGAVEVWVLLKIHPYRLDLVKPWLACGLAMGVSGLVRSVIDVTSVWFTVLLTLGFGVGYLAVLWRLGLNQADRTVFFQFIQKFKFRTT